MLPCLYGESGGAKNAKDGNDNDDYLEIVSTAFEESMCRRKSPGKYKYLP